MGRIITVSITLLWHCFQAGSTLQGTTTLLPRYWILQQPTSHHLTFCIKGLYSPNNGNFLGDQYTLFEEGWIGMYGDRYNCKRFVMVDENYRSQMGCSKICINCMRESRLYLALSGMDMWKCLKDVLRKLHCNRTPLSIGVTNTIVICKTFVKIW